MQQEYAQEECKSHSIKLHRNVFYREEGKRMAKLQKYTREVV